VTNNIKHLWPTPPTTPTEALQHLLDCYPEADDNAYALVATAGRYEEQRLTGLTWGDLRQIAGKLRASNVCRCIREQDRDFPDVTTITFPPDGCPKHEGGST